MSTRAAVAGAKAVDVASLARSSPSPAIEGAESSWSFLLGAGNQTALRLLRGGGLLQPQLVIGGSGDRFEREANRAADRVLEGRDVAPLSEVGAPSRVQRKCRECERREESEPGPASAHGCCASSASLAAGGAACPECTGEREEIQRDAIAGSAPVVGPDLESGIAALRGGGAPLPPALLVELEARFHHDLSIVRVHHGAPSAKAAQLARARAFTVGRDIVFDSGEYQPESRSGRRLLAHEVAHVVQQTPSASRARPSARPGSSAVAAPEREVEPKPSADERSAASSPSAAPPTAPQEVAAALPSDPTPPGSVLVGLGGGRPLAGSVRARMEAAFGARFGGVRVHTTAEASRAAHGLGASAFTVGKDIVFASGEYRPGSLWGDALLAHELAHTEQQRGATRPEGASSAQRTAVLEADASSAAAGALTRVIGGRGPRPTVQRSGLALQRCGATRPSASRPSTTAPGAAPRPSSAPATPESPPPAAPTGDTESDAAAERAKAIEGLLGDKGCQPTPTSLTKMAAIPGASATNFGWTKPATIARSIRPMFDPRTKECFLDSFTAASLTFDHLVYVEPGVHRYGKQKRHDSGCAKELPLYVEVTDDAAKLFKAGEVEHCRDLQRAFALTYARFNTAAAAVKGEGRFPSTSKADCTQKVKDKISAGMGIDYDQVKPIFECLRGKSEERDTKNWHAVDVNLTSARQADSGCTKVVHVLDHTKILPEVGNHPTPDLVKGCGE